MRAGGWLLLALLIGCNAGCAGPTTAEAAAADAGDAFLGAPPSGAFYRDGQLVLTYELDGKQAFFSAAWPMDPPVAGQHSFHMALMAFSKEAPVRPAELANDWQPVILRDFASWQALVRVLLERFAPANPATASLVNVQSADLVLHRDPAGGLQIHRLEDKPAALRVTRYITEEAFSAAANDYLRQELSADGTMPGPVLFAVGEDEFGSAFVLFDFAHAQSVFIALEPDPAGRLPQGSPYHSRADPQLFIADYLREDSQVEVRLVDNPWLTSDHTKVIVIDRATAFVGGMNIGHEYRYTWHDMMVEVQGPIVKRLSKDFDKRWAHTGFGGDLAFAIAAMKPGRYRGPADRPDFVEMRPLYTRTGDPQILRAQVAAIRAARARIYIQQPYFSDDQLIAELIRARQRGVDVRVVLPSQSDSGFMDSANLITARALARNGIRVYVYPGMTHVKAALYDGWAIVGSANFDKLSLRINQETNLATSDPGFAASLERELFDVDFSQSREWSGSEPVRWRDYIGKAIAEQL